MRPTAALVEGKEASTWAVWPAPSVQVNLFTDAADMICFDFDTAEINEPAALRALGQFVELVGQVTGRPVEISDEGSWDFVIMRYDPDADQFIIDERAWQ